MARLLIFANVDPRCQGPGSRGELIPLELELDASPEDIVKQLSESNAIRGEVEVLWQEGYLNPKTELADVGLCPQNIVSIVPARISDRQQTMLNRALVMAAGAGNLESAESVLEMGASNEWRGDDGKQLTAIHCAAENGHVEMVKLLLDNGACIDPPAVEGGQGLRSFTPLLLASVFDHPQVVELLLERGASLQARTDVGESAADLAKRRWNYEVLRLLAARGLHPGTGKKTRIGNFCGNLLRGASSHGKKTTKATPPSTSSVGQPARHSDPTAMTTEVEEEGGQAGEVLGEEGRWKKDGPAAAPAAVLVGPVSESGGSAESSQRQQLGQAAVAAGLAATTAASAAGPRSVDTSPCETGVEEAGGGQRQ